MIQNHLQQIQKEYFNIIPYHEDDLEWWNEGLDLIDQGKLLEALQSKKLKNLFNPDSQTQKCLI